MTTEKEPPVAAVAAVQPEPEGPGPYEKTYATVSLDDLTAGETSDAERMAGQSVTTLGNEAYPQARLIGALGWVAYRRRDPRMKFDAYMSSRKLSDITKELGLGADDEDDEEGKDNDESTSPS